MFHLKESTEVNNEFSFRLTLLVFSILAVFVGTIVSHSVSQAQQTFIDPQLQPHILRGVDLVTNTDYSEAYNEFERMREIAPDDPSSYFLKGIIYWYRFVIEREENEVLEYLFFKYMDQTIEKAKELEKRNKDDILALFWLGAGYGYKARHYSVKGSWWSAYRNGKKTKHYFERVVALAPDDCDPYLGLGIYHYYAEVVPKIIRIFDFILNMGGDKELGLKELEATLDKGFFTKNEAKFFLFDIFLNYEHRPWEALPFLVDLTHRFPGNKGFKWRLAELYGELRLHDAATKIWQELYDAYPEASEKKEAALVYLGEQTLRTGKFNEAQSTLLQAIKMSHQLDPALLSRAYYSLALTSDLLGEHDEALVYYEKVVKVGQGEMVNISQKRMKSSDVLPFEILNECSEILATADISDGSLKSLEDQVHELPSSSNHKQRKHSVSAMRNIGKYYLFHDDPSRAESMFTEILSSDLPRSNDLEASLCELRGVANYRLNRFAEALDYYKMAYEKVKDDERARIEKDIDFIRTSSQRESSFISDRLSANPDVETVTCAFTCPDKGQLAMSVVGDFNDWDPLKGEMSMVSGRWAKEFELSPGKHAYYFLMNGRERRIDPDAAAIERQSGTRYVSIRKVGRVD